MTAQNAALPTLALSVRGAGSDFRRLSRLSLATLLAVYVVLSLRPAAIRPLWYDEIFTLHMARYQNVGELWQHLRGATDLNPPFYYVLVHASLNLFGDNETALRLPGILGYGLLVVCVFAFVARWQGERPAWLAALFLLGCNLSTFAYEARPYAVALGFAGLTLCCWQSAMQTESRRRGALAGLAVCLALTISTHYYAVLLFVPIGLAELAGSRDCKRADRPLWCALVAGAIPLIFFLPLMREARTYSVGFWARPTWDELGKSYLSYVGELGVPLVGTLIVLAVARLVTRERKDLDGAASGAEHAGSAEHWLLAGLALLPVVAILLGQIVTGVYTPRYAVFTIIGLCGLFAVAVFRSLEGAVKPGLVVLLLFGGWFLVQGEARSREWSEKFGNFAFTCGYLRDHSNDQVPLVLADSHHYLQMTHYDRVLARRTVYITSLDLPLRYQLQNTTERSLQALAELTPLQLVEFETFLAEPRRFLLFGKNPWLLNELQHRGVRLVLLEDFGDDKLFEVETYPQATTQWVEGNRP